MPKVKIIQIVNMGESFSPLYLDDKGRVWEKVFIFERDSEGNKVQVDPEDREKGMKGEWKWLMIDFPEEPV